jgi:hypothetical protein
MMIIGCDFHMRYQQIAMMEEATRELTELRLDHESGEADAFYRKLAGWPGLIALDRRTRYLRHTPDGENSQSILQLSQRLGQVCGSRFSRCALRSHFRQLVMSRILH